MREIKVKSSFGEKFYAEVIVNNDAKQGLKASIGNQQDYALLMAKRSKVVDELRTLEPVEFISFDQQLIRIVSDKPLFYPSFDLIIKASLEGGTILEKYSLVVDFKKNMSISLSPPELKEKELPVKTAETLKDMKEKKKTGSPHIKEAKKPEQPKVTAKREVKAQITPEKPEVAPEIKPEEKIAQKKPAKLKKAEITDEEEVKKTVEVPESKEEISYKKTSSKSLFSYTVSSGDTLSSILKKVKPQKADFFYRALVALWKLNKNKFLYDNINGLQTGTRLSFEHLDEMTSKIDGKEAVNILRHQWEEWKKITSGISMDAGKGFLVSAIPLPGENIIVTDDLLEILSGWKQSWENQDMAKHFLYYSNDFLSDNYIGNNINLIGWKQYKDRITNQNKNIKIHIKSLHIRKEGSNVMASFLQKFTSDNLISFGTKKITFVKEGEQWKIKNELFLRQKTEILVSNFPFVVQTSSRKNWEAAIKDANRLRKAGFDAYLVKSANSSSDMRFQVVIGRFRSQKDAYDFAKLLIKGKYTKHAIVQKLPFAVSLGSLKNEEDAYEIIRSFRKKRYSPYLFSVGDGKEVIHHVLVGGYENEGQVNKVSNIISKKGVAHTVIQP